MNQSCFFDNFHSFHNLTYDKSAEIQGYSLERILFQKVIDWIWKQLKNDTEMVSENKKI